MKEAFIQPSDRLNYRIINCSAVTDKAEAGQTANKWIIFTLVDKDDPFDEPFVQSIMSTALASRFETAMITAGIQPVIDQTSGRKAVTATEAQMALLPEELQVITNAGRVTVYFEDEEGKPMLMCRKWGSAGQHTAEINGVSQLVPHQKGEIVKDKHGVVKAYKSVEVFLSYKSATSELPRKLFSFADQFEQATRGYEPIASAQPTQTPPPVTAPTNGGNQGAQVPPVQTAPPTQQPPF